MAGISKWTWYSATTDRQTGDMIVHIKLWHPLTWWHWLTGNDSRWKKLEGRGLYELRLDELTNYVMHLFNYATREQMQQAIEWIVSELARKTNDERILAVQLSRLRGDAEILCTVIRTGFVPPDREWMNDTYRKTALRAVELHTSLELAEDYFDGRADAEIIEGRTHPNAEMHILGAIREALRKAKP